MNIRESKTASMLVLGTAQLGMPYGVANNTGQPDFQTAISIIKTAWEHGIREFDTAQAYGESEAILGRAFSSLGIANEAKIITKLDPRLDPHQRQSLIKATRNSLERLQISSLYGLMVHREEWLDDLNHDLGKIFQELVRLGLVQHLGVSLYSPPKAINALTSDIFDMIQVPANILDQRFADADVFDLADVKGKQVYIRSIFLQGLLLMKAEDVPSKLALVKPSLNKIDMLCEQYGYSRQKIALLYIKAKYPKAKIIIGAETIAQLQQNLNIWKDISTSTADINDFNGLSIKEERIINPSFWS